MKLRQAQDMQPDDKTKDGMVIERMFDLTNKRVNLVFVSPKGVTSWRGNYHSTFRILENNDYS